MMLKALLMLMEKQWIPESAWVKIIGIADKETLLWIKNHCLLESKYFTREDWLGPEAADRLRVIIIDRLDDMNAEGIIAILKGLI